MKQVHRLSTLLLVATAAAADPAAKPYAIEATAPAQATVGKPSSAHVVVTAAAGYHTNKEFPTKLQVTAPAGVAVAKATLVAADAKFSPERIEFEVAFTPTAAGAHELAGDLRFAVCTAQTCVPSREKVAWKVRAQ